MKNFANCNLFYLIFLFIYAKINNKVNLYLPKLFMLALRCIPYFLTKNLFFVMICWNLSYIILPIIFSSSRIIYVVVYGIYLFLNYHLISFLGNNYEQILLISKLMHGLIKVILTYVKDYIKDYAKLQFMSYFIDTHSDNIQNINIDFAVIKNIPGIINYGVFLVFLMLMINYFSNLGLGIQVFSFKINFWGTYLLMYILTGILVICLQQNEQLFEFHENNIHLFDLVIWNPAFIYFYTKYLELDHK